MEASWGGASPSPSPSPGASNLAGEDASKSPVEGFLSPEGPAGSFRQPIPGAARVFVSAEHKLATSASASSSFVLRPTGSRPPTGGVDMSSSPDFVPGDRRSKEGRPEHKRRRFAEGAPTVAHPATPSTSRALLHPKLEWEQEGIPPAPLVAAPVPEPEAAKPWGPKLERIARDRMFTHFPPGVPKKVWKDSNLKIAAAELQRRMGTNADLNHLNGKQQVAGLLHLGNAHRLSRTFPMNRFSDYCDDHPMAHPPPPEA